MSQWAGGVLTAAGRVLQAKVESGTTLTLTKIKLGDGTESMSAVDNLTDLVSPKAVLGISSATSDGDVATITGVMSATLLQAGFYCREWGLFAEDPDAGEILYMITIDSQPEWLPASTEAAQVSATYAMNIAVANATNIEVNIDPAGLVDVEMLQEIIGVTERNKDYSVGDITMGEGLPAMHYLRCVTAGTTGANAPVIGNVSDGDLIADGTVVWQVTKAMSAAELGYRQASTAYTTGNIAYHSALPTGWYLECTTAGTTGSGELSISSPAIGGTVTDGTVTWTIKSLNKSLLNIIGNDLSDCNDAVNNGLYSFGSDTANKPGYRGTLLSMRREDRCGQLAFNLDGDNMNKYYLRLCRSLESTSPVYTDWQQIDTIVAKSLGTNGYIKYASGLIIQWGSTITSGTSPQTIYFPIAYTHNAFAILVSEANSTSSSRTYSVNRPTDSVASFDVYFTTANVRINWISIGY